MTCGTRDSMLLLDCIIGIAIKNTLTSTKSVLIIANPVKKGVSIMNNLDYNLILVYLIIALIKAK